jgi:hypothetical protein
VEAARDEVDARIDRGHRLDDVVDARMRAADHEHHAVGRIEGQRKLAQLERAGLSDTSAIRCMPGAICVVLSTSRMSACGHAAPKRITSAGLPSK